MFHQSPDHLARCCLVMHRRFLEVGERIARLPESSQQAITLRLWQELKAFLSLDPSEEAELTIDLCQRVNGLLEAIDRMIDIEGESMEVETALNELGRPEVAESFRQRRHRRWSQA